MGMQCGYQVKNNTLLVDRLVLEFSGKEGCRRGKNIILAMGNSRQL